MTPNTIQFHDIDSTWVMRITADRRIEVNEDVEVTEAAKKVLDAMQGLLTPQRQWVGLNDSEIGHVTKSFDARLSVRLGISRAIEAKLNEKNT